MMVELEELQQSARRVMHDLGLAATEDVVWSQIIELGWLLVSLPENMGGLEAGIKGAAIMHSELGRGLSTAPYLPAMLAADIISQSQADARDQLLESLISGELITTPLADSDITLSDNRITGTAIAVQAADQARQILVATSAGECIVLIEPAQTGVEIIPTPTWDQTRNLFEVQLTDIELSKQIVLAEGLSAVELTRRMYSLRDFALSADAIGGANALLELTVEHLQSRVQFKRPLAMFQALKHRCANMKTSVLAAEAMLSAALADATALDSNTARTHAMAAKCCATSMFSSLAEDCLQLHGGIGMADEHPCHLFLKRALLNNHLSGENNAYATAIGRSLAQPCRP
ncbi:MULTISPECIES: acyl-CoA dehydrogenase family protein [unclassified Ketobacter]|uniref:acyl-CoA dehydrogenase family protein n=1 Tax=unclassified Ketobacter TaxID=2639109 RepID=UPI000F172476|nr:MULTISPECIES: acyl-CoA dehydrogenase family protein [unclassified Ketobacter]MCK5789462.1 acyl-CoA/acyl-ACP dehydrogenase [Ketobacter sp.]RLT90238.1 MAG: acyl-CoA dehydrogenase [Ketobacter sp. GenoA1]RLT93565.1 MAG: acyl-CoA dehydrogenase [Ketobacter sp.]